MSGDYIFTADDLAQSRQERAAAVGGLLHSIWADQIEYNAMIQSVQAEHRDNWMEVYLLGLISEVDELLEAAKWKRHLTNANVHPLRSNVSAQLADMTKYLFSLWQHFGFSDKEMLEAMDAKAAELRLRLAAEFFPPDGRDVIVFDLDGTVADWRRGFSEWWGRSDAVRSLHADLDNAVAFDEYENAKADFESNGGYASLPDYPDAVELLRNALVAGAFLFCTTARPVDNFQRVRNDTLNWLSDRKIYPGAIVFGRDERILRLLRLAKNNRVVLMDDDPTHALRAAGGGIAVMLRDQPYNRGAEHPLIKRFAEFPATVPWDMFQEGG